MKNIENNVVILNMLITKELSNTLILSKKRKIKDTNYWKIYNQKRKERGYFHSLYQKKKAIVKNKSLQPAEILLSCSTCSNMNATYGTNQSWCLNCSLKIDNQEEIVPLGLVQKLQGKILALQEQNKKLKQCNTVALQSKDREWINNNY